MSANLIFDFSPTMTGTCGQSSCATGFMTPSPPSALNRSCRAELRRERGSIRAFASEYSWDNSLRKSAILRCHNNSLPVCDDPIAPNDRDRQLCFRGWLETWPSRNCWFLIRSSTTNRCRRVFSSFSSIIWSSIPLLV